MNLDGRRQVKLYASYGLTIASDLDLPDLPRAQEAPADVTLSLSKVPAMLDGASRGRENWQANGRRFQIELPGVARYRVEQGDLVQVELLDTSASALAADYFLTSVMGAVLQQRGFLPLHASGVVTPRGAVLFCGLSGTGKSTLLAQYRQAGYEMITDDIAPLRADTTGQIVAMPGYPRHRLTQVSVNRLAMAVGDQKLRDASIPKYALPVTKMARDPQPVHAICHLGLTLDKTVTVEHVSLSEAVPLIMRNTFRRRFIKGMGLMQMHFDLATRLARQAQVMSYGRPALHDSFDSLPKRIADDLGFDQ